MPSHRETFPSAPESLLLVAGLFFVEYLIAVMLYAMEDLTGIDPQSAAAGVRVLGSGILFSFLLAYKRMNYATLFHASPNSVAITMTTLTGPILLLVPGLVFLIMAVEAVLVALVPMSGWEQEMFEQMMSNGVASAITVSLLAPILEEMLFRGIILRSFLSQYRPRTAILLSALLFGLVHLNIYQFVAGLVLGLLLGWLYERTRSLLPCITLHATYNSAILLLSGWSAAPSEPAGGESGLLLFGLAAIALSVYGARSLKRLLAPEQQ